MSNDNMMAKAFTVFPASWLPLSEERWRDLPARQKDTEIDTFLWYAKRYFDRFFNCDTDIITAAAQLGREAAVGSLATFLCDQCNVWMEEAPYDDKFDQFSWAIRNRFGTTDRINIQWLNDPAPEEGETLESYLMAIENALARITNVDFPTLPFWKIIQSHWPKVAAELSGGHDDPGIWPYRKLLCRALLIARTEDESTEVKNQSTIEETGYSHIPDFVVKASRMWASSALPPQELAVEDFSLACGIAVVSTEKPPLGVSLNGDKRISDWLSENITAGMVKETIPDKNILFAWPLVARRKNDGKLAYSLDFSSHGVQLEKGLPQRKVKIAKRSIPAVPLEPLQMSLTLASYFIRIVWDLSEIYITQSTMNVFCFGIDSLFYQFTKLPLNFPNFLPVLHQALQSGVQRPLSEVLQKSSGSSGVAAWTLICRCPPEGIVVGGRTERDAWCAAALVLKSLKRMGIYVKTEQIEHGNTINIYNRIFRNNSVSLSSQCRASLIARLNSIEKSSDQEFQKLLKELLQISGFIPHFFCLTANIRRAAANGFNDKERREIQQEADRLRRLLKNTEPLCFKQPINYPEYTLYVDIANLGPSVSLCGVLVFKSSAADEGWHPIRMISICANDYVNGINNLRLFRGIPQGVSVSMKHSCSVEWLKSYFDDIHETIFSESQ